MSKNKRDGSSTTSAIADLVFQVLDLHCRENDTADDGDPGVTPLVDVCLRARCHLQRASVVKGESSRNDEVSDDFITAPKVVIKPRQNKKEGRLFPYAEKGVPAKHKRDGDQHQPSCLLRTHPTGRQGSPRLVRQVFFD